LKGGKPESAPLRDGSSVLIRPIGSGDRELLQAGFERLSERSRYMRFQSPLAGLSDRQLSYLTAVDHHDHEALVGVDPDTGDLVAVARFVRVDDGVAECAIVVADDWQGRGVATTLLDRLVDRAREEGIERFTALLLAENNEALRLLERLGDTDERRVGSQHRRRDHRRRRGDPRPAGRHRPEGGQPLNAVARVLTTRSGVRTRAV
jgi:RimJ/RimL family protein N-acetyltransferase